MKHTDKYKYMKKSEVKSQAKHLVDKCSDGAIHTINKFLIFKFYSFEVVNSEKLTIDCFETEQEAIDFCLDRFSGSKIPTQLIIASQKDIDPDIQDAVNEIYWDLL